MLKLLRLITLAGFFLGFQEASAAVQKNTLLQARLQLPYGDSYWPIDFPQRPVLENLELGYLIAPNCEKVSYRIDYLPAGSNVWYAAAFQNGYYRTNGQPIQSMRVWLNQRVSPRLFCEFKLQQVLVDGTTPPDQGTSVYLGLIKYQGGFALNQPITLPQTVVGRTLEVLVPEFCGDVEVLEVALSQQGKISKARPLNPEGQTWILSQPSAFEQIQVTLNGPVGLACEIPVYLKN